MFDGSSRYAHIEVVSVPEQDGSSRAYLKRRFVPQPAGELLGTIAVEQGDRLDTITARALGDPLQFWRVCDGNQVMNPFDLVEEPGRRIAFRVTVG